MRSIAVFIVSVACIAASAVLQWSGCLAAEKEARVQDQTEATVIHVDKYGVYVSGKVFYWDPDMNKQKSSTLMSTAERLRNKKVIITYSAVGNLAKDRRPVVVDLVPSGEESRKSEIASAPKESPREQRPSDLPPPPPREERAPPAPPEPSDPRLSQDIEREIEREIQERRRNRPLPPPPPPSMPEDTRPSVPSSPISKAEVGQLVETILRLTEREDISAIIGYYADQVDYYQRGVVNRDYIRKDLGYYFKNWDEIACSLESDIEFLDSGRSGGTATIRFISGFAVENVKKAVSGKTENVWTIQRIDGRLKIIDQKQKILRSESRQHEALY